MVLWLSAKNVNKVTNLIDQNALKFRIKFKTVQKGIINKAKFIHVTLVQKGKWLIKCLPIPLMNV